MASATEQLAANFNWGSFAKAEDLKKRIWFTLAALIVFRIGSRLPLPGIDTELMQLAAQRNAQGILGLFDKFTGGALGHMAIFALGLMPYISASIIVQLMTAVIPQLETLKKEGESGRKKLNQYTRMGTVFLAMVQSFGISVGLESMPGSPVIDPGMLFRLSTMLTITGGTLFLMWLGEQITSRGVGNGVSIIIFAGIVSGMPSAIVRLLELGRTKELPPFMIFVIILILIAAIAFIVFMERAQRRVHIQYPKRMVGNRQTGGDSTHMPLKLNTAGVIPPIFASALLMLPSTLASFSSQNNPDSFLGSMLFYLGHGKPLFVLCYVALIIFFAFFYTAVVFNPTEIADNLKKGGAIVPGYRPGSNTAEYLDYVLTRITVVGALYLAVICALPELLIQKYSIPFYLGGTSLLIVVSVSIDTVTQIQSHLLAHQYEGLIRRMRPRKGK
jgi:preprotein translocase subunit SecY